MCICEPARVALPTWNSHINRSRGGHTVLATCLPATIGTFYELHRVEGNSHHAHTYRTPAHGHETKAVTGRHWRDCRRIVSHNRVQYPYWAIVGGLRREVDRSSLDILYLTGRARVAARGTPGSTARFLANLSVESEWVDIQGRVGPPVAITITRRCEILTHSLNTPLLGHKSPRVFAT